MIETFLVTNWPMFLTLSAVVLSYGKIQATMKYMSKDIDFLKALLLNGNGKQFLKEAT